MIGLDQTLYSVTEDDTTVEVCVEIKSGSVERTASLTLETDDITAEGTVVSLQLGHSSKLS